MKIAITTPTGHVGSAAADFLLELGGDVNVSVLGRRPAGLQRFVQRGAKMLIGSLDDADFLIKATLDADALFWVTPPAYGSDDLRVPESPRQGRRNRRPRQPDPAGRQPVVDWGRVRFGSGTDQRFAQRRRPARQRGKRHYALAGRLLLREPAVAVGCDQEPWENLAAAFRAQRRPMLATRDIGRVAAQRLADPKWTGRCVRELHGPADLSFDEAAEILSQALGRKIVYVKCDPEETRQTMLDNAVSENVADLMLEMYDAVETGKLRHHAAPFGGNDDADHAGGVRP